MPDFSNALQGYENGANNAVRVGAERLAIKTPVQSFLDALHQRQEMGLQQQQIQALGGYRQGMLENAANRNDTTAQHFQDMAGAATAKQGLAEQKLKQALALSSRRLDIQQQIANTNQATGEGRQKVLALQAELQDVDLQTRDALNESKINFNNMGGLQRNASAAKDVATTPGSGVGNPALAAKIMLDNNKKVDAANAMNAGLKGYTPIPRMTPEEAAAQAAALNAPAAEKDAVTLQDETPGPQSSMMPDVSSQLNTQPSPLEALLKSKKPMGPGGLPVGGIAPSGPPPEPGPYPPQPNMKPNYPVDASGASRFNMGDPKQAAMMPPAQPVTGMQPSPLAAMLNPQAMAPINPGVDNGASIALNAPEDPLHGQYSKRDPGVYSLGGKQYLVDGSGVIQALPT